MKNMKDFLTGKSEEDVRKGLNKLSPEQRISKMIEFDAKILSDDEFIKLLDRIKSTKTYDISDPGFPFRNDKLDLKLYYACEYGSVKAVKYMLDKGAKYNGHQYQKVLLAFLKDHTDIAMIFMNKMREDDVLDKLSIRGNYCLIQACKNGNLKLVQELVKNKVDLIFPNNDPFKYACKSGNIELVKYLLNTNRINPSSGNNAALYSAFIEKKYNIVNFLLQDDSVIQKLEKDPTFKKTLMDAELL